MPLTREGFSGRGWKQRSQNDSFLPYARAMTLNSLGLPFGPTLEALLSLNPTCDFIFLDDGPAHLADRVVVLGEAANGWFGVSKEHLGESLDQSRVVYADRQGMSPVFATANLADFLSVLVFFPDFFALSMDEAKWDELHREATSIRAEDPHSNMNEVLCLLTLPGVRNLASGKEVVSLIDGARVCGDSNPAASPSSARPQSFEDTKARIRAVEVRAMRILGVSEEAIAKSVGIAVADLPKT